MQYERRAADPLVDPRVIGARGQWPIQLASALFGISVLGAQIPLSTFTRTDPARAGYGLGVTASGVSLLVGGYVLALAVGALLLPVVASRLSTRDEPRGRGEPGGRGVRPLSRQSHDDGGRGTQHDHRRRGLVAALPAAAAEAASPTHTAQVAGLTKMTKTLGGAVASSVFALALATNGTVVDAGPGDAG